MDECCVAFWCVKYRMGTPLVPQVAMCVWSFEATRTWMDDAVLHFAA
jgi:hypothetical protein